MTMEEIKKEIETEKYNFLKTNPYLGKNIIMLSLGGSHAYGLNREDSDVDLRGIALNSKEEILLGKDFETMRSEAVDTTIYSFNKMIDLLTKCNPNTIECLGLQPEHYLVLSDIGKELVDNRKIFLSKICIHTFGGYSNTQLRRMENKSARLVDQRLHESYVLKSIENAGSHFKSKYFEHNDDSIKLYIDSSERKDLDSEIFMDLNLSHYPLRDWVEMWNEMKSIVSTYDKVGKRNENAITHNKLGKHMAHLIRLYMMCIDILEKEEIITFRTDEHDLLMSIRNGDYLDDKRQPTEEFYDLLNEYEKRFEYAKENTSLPDKPDYKAINELKMNVNERIVKGEL